VRISKLLLMQSRMLQKLKVKDLGTLQGRGFIAPVLFILSKEVVMGFLSGKKSCWECGGSGFSSRGYGDSSPCGTCDTTGVLRVSRIKIVIDGIWWIIRSIKKVILKIAT
jgi:DnaJ-class molecular chaperone